MDLQEQLERHFGFTEFRPGQLPVITSLLEGHSAGAVFPTGSGKSLCYQLPALLLEGLTLVVSPLIALMKDQIDALRSRGIAAERLDSTLEADEYRAVMNQLRAGQLKMLYVAPERFNNERFRQTIINTRIAVLAIDEAHCISEWGHNFRPDYLKLADFSRRCGAERNLALTATATPAVREDMCQWLGIEPDRMVVTGCYRPNLTVLTTIVTPTTRNEVLLQKMQERERGPAIVYVTLQKTAEDVAQRLANVGFDARPYHAGLKDEERNEIQEWFIDSADRVVVATIAFGMGIDKSNIRYVYHYNLPKSLENYSQEIGRAGRDGLPSICESLICLDDLTTLENFAYGDTPTPQAVRSLLATMFSHGSEFFDISYYEISYANDIRLSVARTIITYLELMGYFEIGTPFYQSYSFKPILSSKEILQQFAGERREFLANILRCAREARTWFHIDLNETAQKVQAPRDRIVTALDYLGEQQMLEVRASGVRNRFRQIKESGDLDELSEVVQQRLLQREQREIDRLQQMIEIARMDGCQVAALCRHFGEERAQPCGHCSWCLNGHALPLPDRPHEPFADELYEIARQLQAEDELLQDPVSLTRVLCGVSSPRIVRAKLTRHRGFGAAAHIPYPDVLAAVEGSAKSSP